MKKFILLVISVCFYLSAAAQKSEPTRGEKHVSHFFVFLRHASRIIARSGETCVFAERE